jgi:hypothetical protein
MKSSSGYNTASSFNRLESGSENQMLAIICYGKFTSSQSLIMRQNVMYEIGLPAGLNVREGSRGSTPTSEMSPTTLDVSPSTSQDSPLTINHSPTISWAPAARMTTLIWTKTKLGIVFCVCARDASPMRRTAGNICK